MKRMLFGNLVHKDSIGLDRHSNTQMMDVVVPEVARGLKKTVFLGFLWSHHRTSTKTELYKPFLSIISSKAVIF